MTGLEAGSSLVHPPLQWSIASASLGFPTDSLTRRFGPEKQASMGDPTCFSLLPLEPPALF